MSKTRECKGCGDTITDGRECEPKSLSFRDHVRGIVDKYDNHELRMLYASQGPRALSQIIADLREVLRVTQ